MTVTVSQLTVARQEGLEATAVEAARRAADTVGASFYQLCALLEQESSTGANMYGSDPGGTLSGFRDPVNETNWRAFRHEVITRGRPSNGVGPLQITYPGYFRQMETRGLQPWRAADSVLFGAELYWGHFRKAKAGGVSTATAIRWAGTWFNAGPDETDLKQPYANDLLDLAEKWRDLVGVADTKSRETR